MCGKSGGNSKANRNKSQGKTTRDGGRLRQDLACTRRFDSHRLFSARTPSFPGDDEECTTLVCFRFQGAFRYCDFLFAHILSRLLFVLLRNRESSLGMCL